MQLHQYLTYVNSFYHAQRSWICNCGDINPGEEYFCFCGVKKPHTRIPKDPKVPALITISCSLCGKEIQRYHKDIDKNFRNFCSRKCYNNRRFVDTTND